MGHDSFCQIYSSSLCIIIFTITQNTKYQLQVKQHYEIIYHDKSVSQSVNQAVTEAMS